MAIGTGRHDHVSRSVDILGALLCPHLPVDFLGFEDFISLLDRSDAELRFHLHTLFVLLLIRQIKLDLFLLRKVLELLHELIRHLLDVAEDVRGLSFVLFPGAHHDDSRCLRRLR